MLLERVLENARFAPSGGNRQGWRMIVVTDPQLRRRMRELYEQPWNDYMVRTGGRAALNAGEASGLAAGRLRMLRGADEFAHVFDEVPVHLVVCTQVESLAITDAELDRPSIVGGASIYPFVQNVLLGLRHEGLASAFTTLLVPAEAQLRELLDIPEDYAVAGHISVGYRDGDWPHKLTRNPVSEFAFGERFGQPWG